MARRVLDGAPAIIAHAAYETYSSLTRMPPPERLAAQDVRALLDDWFGDRWLGLAGAQQRLALERLEELGVAGGATYDGLIGLTAAANGAKLLTLDRRALPVYALVGVDVELVA